MSFLGRRLPVPILSPEAIYTHHRGEIPFLKNIKFKWGESRENTKNRWSLPSDVTGRSHDLPSVTRKACGRACCWSQTYHVLFTVSFFFAFVLFCFVYMVAICMFWTWRGKVYLWFILWQYRASTSCHLYTHLFFTGCEKFSMSHITVVIVAEKDHGPKTVWKVEGQGMYIHWHTIHKDFRWEINYVFYHLFLLKQTVSGQEELFFLHHHFYYCMKKLFWEKWSISSSY